MARRKKRAGREGAGHSGITDQRGCKIGSRNTNHSLEDQPAGNKTDICFEVLASFRENAATHGRESAHTDTISALSGLILYWAKSVGREGAIALLSDAADLLTKTMPRDRPPASWVTM